VRALDWKVFSRPDVHAGAAAGTAASGSRAAEDTARRLARELHDSAGQLLATAHLAIDGLHCAEGCPTASRLPELKAILDRAEEELRRLSHELRPPALETLGLTAALTALAESESRRSGLSVELHSRLQRRPAPEMELHLFRAAQEALTNVVRHARATRAAIRLQETRGRIVLEVEDDGVGLEAAGRTPAGAGLGLLTMTERAELLGGRVCFGTGAAGGTLVQLDVPAAQVVPCAC
jgi:signal transduction histidine kinase